ncbi:MBL fold metallo-hydrolase [Bradyrhizobium rifense]|uniref:MBL fold metallo-hydrolase n=1 Tax=Bradyrhizobium rifense TaxID=515499 RepID=A0A5D3JZ42_9BRAD|nr:MBL fold metallo-hydrolase [Bradyrhizobium rifense]TYL82244.1 MBL fold metallo-hydrolase [Bradyrhizobium rifense]
MTFISRRGLLAGGAALAAATDLPFAGSSRAAAPLAGQQAPGFYRYQVGDFEVSVISDGAVRFPVEGFVTNASTDQVKAALTAAFRSTDGLTVPFTPIVVNTGQKLILIDTGLGDAAVDRTKGTAGQFAANLKAAGLDRKDIDAVVISHFHVDHVDGLLTADNKPAFPNAEIFVPAAELKFWMDDGEMSRAPKGRIEGLFKNTRRIIAALGGKVTPFEAGKEVVPGNEIVPGLTAVATPGHSVGHTSFVLSSSGKSVFVQGDVAHIPVLFVENPGWHAAIDQDPVMAEATRRRIYDMLVAEKMLVQGFHYPFPALAHVERTANGYREILVPWSTSI